MATKKAAKKAPAKKAAKKVAKKKKLHLQQKGNTAGERFKRSPAVFLAKGLH